VVRNSIVLVGTLALGACSRAHDVREPVARAPDTAADRAAIEVLESDWSRAFLARDYARVEQLVAPEFRLVGWNPTGMSKTLRPAWMVNARRFDFKVYETTLLDVVVVDDTAVATLSGNWTIGIGDKVMPNDKFLVTDTWVRRGGRWQVIARNAQSIPLSP
jgi:hypothetical protein